MNLGTVTSVAMEIWWWWWWSVYLYKLGLASQYPFTLRIRKFIIIYQLCHYFQQYK